jgi:hypothetical protein
MKYGVQRRVLLDLWWLARGVPSAIMGDISETVRRERTNRLEAGEWPFR